MIARKPGQCKCSKCKKYYNRSELHKHNGGLLCDSCIRELQPQGRVQWRVPRTTTHVSKDVKLDLRDE